MVDFGKRIKALRKSAGLTQQQVAERLWVTKAMVSSYELGTRSPSYEVLIKLAKLFNVTTDYLLGLDPGSVIEADGLTESQLAAVNAVVNELRKANGE